MAEITASEFRRRLINLCIGSDRIFPTKTLDRHVMLASASRSFERGLIYTQDEVDSAIRSWLDRGCPALTIDEVTIRRELIDAAYLMRDDAGRFYGIGPGPASIRFEESVGDIDPIAVVAQAVSERIARQRARTRDRLENPDAAEDA